MYGLHTVPAGLLVGRAFSERLVHAFCVSARASSKVSQSAIGGGVLESVAGSYRATHGKSASEALKTVNSAAEKVLAVSGTEATRS